MGTNLKSLSGVLLMNTTTYLDRFLKNLSIKIVMSEWMKGSGWLRPRFTFWLTFLKNLSIMLLGIFLIFFFL